MKQIEKLQTKHVIGFPITIFFKKTEDLALH